MPAYFQKSLEKVVGYTKKSLEKVCDKAKKSLEKVVATEKTLINNNISAKIRLKTILAEKVLYGICYIEIYLAHKIIGKPFNGRFIM